MSATTPRWKRAATLSWSVPAAVVSGLTLAVALAVLCLGATGSLDALMNDTTPIKGLALALVPTLALALATLTGMIAGATVVASLVGDTMAGHRGRFCAGWGRAWRTLPKVLVLGAVGIPAVLLSLILWPALSIAVLVRGAWRLRTPETRADTAKSPRAGLWLAVPFAFALAVLAALPTTWSHLVAGETLRDATRAAAAATLRARGAVLGGLVVLGLTSWGLGALGLKYTAAPSASTSEFATGTAVLGLTTATLLAVAGSLLGLLTHAQAAPTARPATQRPSRSVMFSRFWRPTRLAATASLAIVALLAPIMAGAIGGAASAWAEQSETDFVVTTLADSTTIASTACVNAAPCSVRAALSKAAAAAALGDPAVVRFGVEGTINLVATLRVGSGVTINGNDAVTLNGQRARRVLETFTASRGEGARVVLRNFTVAGGRSAVGGAGLFSDTIRAELSEMTFTDNVSDAGTNTAIPAAARNGGAIAMTNTYLRLENSTFSDNYARSGVGGAIQTTQAGSSAIHFTVIGGGGIAGTATNQIQVANSAVDASARPSALACSQIVPATDDPYSSSVGNVDPNGTCGGTRAPLAPIGELADNGGRTKTVALLPGSAAIAAANADICDYADQRGTGRDASVCDSGAFQSSVADMPKVDVTLDVTPNPASPTDPIRLQATLSSEAQIPTGTVRFLDGTDVVADNVALDYADRFIATIPPLPRGPHQITAEFVPTYVQNPPSTSPATKLQVQTPVTMTLTSGDPTRLHEPATVIAQITDDAAAAGVPGPEGKVVFTNGDTTETVDVVAGVATWRTHDLQRSSVNAHYLGDDFHAVTVKTGNVTTENIPTTTTLTAPSSVEYASPVDIVADVTDQVGPVHGSARLELDGTLAESIPLRDGKATFRRATYNKLTPGQHTVRVITDPEAGWSASTSTTKTIDVTAATSTISLAQPRELVWSGLYETIDATITGHGTATVRLLDGDTVLDERRDVDLTGGGHQFTFHIYKTEPGTHNLTAEIVASNTAKGATSAPVTLKVTKAPSYIGLSKGPPANVGETATITVFSRGGGAEGTLRLTDTDGHVLATAQMTAGGATLSWVPTSSGYADLKVTLTPDEDSNYLPTSETTSIQTGAGSLSAPSLTWTLFPVAGSTALTVTFADLTPAVTGQVRLRNTLTGEVIGTAAVADGKAVVDVYAANKCFCNGALRLEYLGAGDYNSATFFAPDVSIPAHVTTTTLDTVADTQPAGALLRLSARTTTSTTGYMVEGATTFTVNGTDLPAVTVDSAGVARVNYQTTGPGQVTISARFAPTNPIFAASTSATATTTVAQISAPEVTLSTSDSPVAGQPFELKATAGRYGFHIADRSPVYIYDGDGNVVGTGTWTATVFGTTATVTVTPRKGGANTFTARYTYGDRLNGTSAAFTKTVAGTPTKLKLTTVTTQPRTGLPVFLTATFDQSATPALEAGAMMLQLHANGQPVGDPVKLAKGMRTVDLTTIAARTGSVTYSVTTSGDGASFGSGSAWLQLNVAGDTPLLRTESGSVIKGRTWTSKTTLTGQPGSPAPTGSVHVTLVDAAGEARAACTFVMPGTGCDIKTANPNLPRDLYTVRTEYFGDNYYAGLRTTGYGPTPTSLRVYSDVSSLQAAVTPDGTGYGWQTGEQIKATWTAFDPHNQTPSGTVEATFGGRTVCTAPAAAGSCSFEAPENPRPAGVDQWSWNDLKLTYTPDEALPSTRTLSVNGPRRCLPVQTRLSLFSSTLPAPSVTGEAACVRPGTAGGGFLEGTRVTVGLPQGLPNGYKTTEWRITARGATEVFPAEDREAVFTITDTTYVAAQIAWAPVCVTVIDEDRERRRDVAGLDATRLPDYRDQGYVELKTPSNCSDPNGAMTSGERADFNLGIGHYAVGTDIQAAAYGLKKKITEWGPRYVGIGVKGMSAPDATHPFPHLVLTSDMRLTGKYAIDPVMCTPVNLYTGVGGKMDVLSTKKPWRMYEADAKARCLTETGKPGFWAFSTIEVQATPKSSYTREGYFQNRWFDGDDLATTQARADKLKPEAVGDFPEHSDPDLFTSNRSRYWLDHYTRLNPYKPQNHDFKVPLRVQSADTADFGVGFAEVRCIKLDLRLSVPVKSQTDRQGPGYSITAPNCGDRGAYRYNWLPQAEPGKVGRQATHYWDPIRVSTGRWTNDLGGVAEYLPGTKVTVRVDQTTAVAETPSTPSTPSAPGATETPAAGAAPVAAASTPFTLQPGSTPRTLQWKLASNAALREGTESRAGQLEITMDRDQWLRGIYAPNNCRPAPKVRITPAGLGGYSVDPSTAGGCSPGSTDPSVLSTVSADPVPNLRPVWSMGKQPTGDVSQIPEQAGYEQEDAGVGNHATTTVKNQTFEFYDVTARYNALPRPVELFYCQDLKVYPVVSDRNGDPLTSEMRRRLGIQYGLEAKEMLRNGGSCPAPMMALPNTNVQIGLTADTQRKFEYRGASLDGTPVPQGTVPSVRVNADGTSPQSLTIGLKPRCFALKMGPQVAPATAPTCPGAVEGQWEYLPGTVVVVKFTADEVDTLKGWNGVDKVDGSDESVAAVMMNRDRDVSATFETASGLELAFKVISNIEQRIISALVSAVTGMVTGFLFVVQVASLLVVGIAEGLSALGVEGAGIEKMKDVGNAIQSGIDMVNAVADCTQTWATGDGAPPFSPGNDHADNAIGVGTDLVGDQIEGDGRLNHAGGAVLEAYALTTMFATGLEAYLQEPAESWANIVDIGSCVEQKGRDVGNAVVQVGR